MKNRIYKDTLFKYMFGRAENKKWLLSLYNALSGSDCADEDELEITTIEDIIYITRKNDVSFLIGSEMYLLEQQSIYNPNMPLRGLMYFSQLYNKFIVENDKDLFGRSLVKIPAPTFYVFYNGTQKTEDRQLLRLSDSFERPAEGFEWTAVMLNVNFGHNKELLDKCSALRDYAKYVKMVRENIEAKKMPVSDAVNAAVDEAVRLNLLGGFFKTHRAEVLDMCLTEFDQESYDRHRRAEGYEEGREDGMRQNRFETARKMLWNGLPFEMIADCTSLPIDEIAALQAEMNPA